MSFGAFMFIKKISYTGKAYKIIRDISCMSYGMYLMHMLILPYIFGLCNSAMSPAITILVTALVTYVICYIITKMISCLKYGKYIVGWFVDCSLKKQNIGNVIIESENWDCY